jgi:hypothetical protein
MATPALDGTEFLFARCPACEKSVLTHVADFNDLGEEIRHCVHCDTQVATGWELVGAEELEARGYSLVEARACGNGGGCGAGCGMRS